MRNDILIGGIAFITGALLGGTAVLVYEKNKKNDKPLVVEEPKHDEIIFTKEERSDYVNASREYKSPEPVVTEEPLPETGHPVDSDEDEEEEDEDYQDSFDAKELKEYLDKNKNKITTLKKEDYESRFNFPDYDRVDLLYFTEEDILCEKDTSEILEPQEMYVGEVLKKLGFKGDDSTCVYVRNNPTQVDYKIEKIYGSYNEYF